MAAENDRTMNNVYLFTNTYLFTFIRMFFFIVIVYILSIMQSNAQCDTSLINSQLDSIYRYIYTETSKADSLSQIALENSENCNYNKGYYWSIYFRSMIFHINYKKYKLAQNLIEKNLKWGYEHELDSVNVGAALYFLFNGVIDYRTNNYEKSHFYLNKAVELSIKTNENRCLAYAFTYLSFIYSCKNEPDSSVIYALKADSLCNLLNINIDKIISKNNLGVSYLLANNLDTSEYYYNQALDSFIKLNDQFGILNVKSNLGYIYLKRKEYSKAKKVLTESYEKSKELGFNEIEYRSSIRLHMVYDSLGDLKQAYKFYKLANQNQDSIISIEQMNKLNAIRENYELKLKENENTELKRINNINKLKLRNKQIIQTGIIVFSLTLLLFALILYRKYKKIHQFSEKIRLQEQEILQKEKEKIKQSLEYKRRELTTKTLKMFHTNQLIDDLSDKLAKLRSKIRTRGKVGEEIRKDIQLMLNEIRLSANNKIWQEVEVSFNEANPDFIKWLNSRFPSLTPNEVKLCIFSMLQLKTKDISMIWMKSSITIQVARTRLRKKLNMNDPNISLSTYLNNEYTVINLY